jgi:hypothetical protein
MPNRYLFSITTKQVLKAQIGQFGLPLLLPSLSWRA